MNKTELIQAIAERAGVTKSVAGNALESIIGTITDLLVLGEEVVITGFGKFHVKATTGGERRNPRTGGKVQVEPSRKPKFTPGKALKEAVK